jgi:hypothetical protein
MVNKRGCAKVVSFTYSMIQVSLDCHGLKCRRLYLKYLLHSNGSISIVKGLFSCLYNDIAIRYYRSLELTSYEI